MLGAPERLRLPPVMRGRGPAGHQWPTGRWGQVTFGPSTPTLHFAFCILDSFFCGHQWPTGKWVESMLIHFGSNISKIVAVVFFCKGYFWLRIFTLERWHSCHVWSFFAQNWPFLRHHQSWAVDLKVKKGSSPCLLCVACLQNPKISRWSCVSFVKIRRSQV